MVHGLRERQAVVGVAGEPSPSVINGGCTLNPFRMRE
jgi:hypothetical protein